MIVDSSMLFEMIELFIAQIDIEYLISIVPPWVSLVGVVLSDRVKSSKPFHLLISVIC